MTNLKILNLALNIHRLEKARTANTVYKKLLVLAGTKLGAPLPASFFISANPRSRTRNFSYTKTLWARLKRQL